MSVDSLYDESFAALKAKADPMLEGAYGFCRVFKDHPGEDHCMKRQSFEFASLPEDGSFIIF